MQMIVQQFRMRMRYKRKKNVGTFIYFYGGRIIMEHIMFNDTYIVFLRRLIDLFIVSDFYD